MEKFQATFDHRRVIPKKYIQILIFWPALSQGTVDVLVGWSRFSAGSTLKNYVVKQSNLLKLACLARKLPEATETLWIRYGKVIHDHFSRISLFYLSR